MSLLINWVYVLDMKVRGNCVYLRLFPLPKLQLLADIEVPGRSCGLVARLNFGWIDCIIRLNNQSCSSLIRIELKTGKAA